MFFAAVLLNRLSNIFTRKSDSNLNQLMEAVGNELDQIPVIQRDPEFNDYYISNNQVITGETTYSTLAEDFAISTATGEALDRHGEDWGIARRLDEIDDDYRKRIQAVVPIYTNGPTVPTMKQIVKNFTGTDPVIIEYGPDGFTMGVSPMGGFVFSDEDVFTFQVQVQNPDNAPYIRSDLEGVVNQAKPARAAAIFVHQGGV